MLSPAQMWMSVLTAHIAVQTSPHAPTQWAATLANVCLGMEDLEGCVLVSSREC